MKTNTPTKCRRWLLFSLLAAGSTYGQSTYYLQGDVFFNDTPVNPALWYDAPTGGTQQTSNAIFTNANTFDMNGFEFSTDNNTDVVFEGNLVSGPNGGTMLANSGNFFIPGGLTVNNPMTILNRRTGGASSRVKFSGQPSGTGPGVFAVNADVSMTSFEGGSELNVVDIPTFTGSGNILFGTNAANDASSSFRLRASNSTHTGNLEVLSGLVFLTGDYAGSNLIVSDTLNNMVEFASATAVALSSVSYGSTTIDTPGTYTVEELNTAFSATGVFAGADVTIIPEPGTYALLTGLSGFAFLMLRRRRLRV